MASKLIECPEQFILDTFLIKLTQFDTLDQKVKVLLRSKTG